MTSIFLIRLLFLHLYFSFVFSNSIETFAAQNPVDGTVPLSCFLLWMGALLVFDHFLEGDSISKVLWHYLEDRYHTDFVSWLIDHFTFFLARVGESWPWKIASSFF